MDQLIQAILKGWQVIYDAFWEAYLQEGAPYGQTHDGMIPWMQDLAHHEEEMQNAEETAIWQKELADLRAKLKGQDLR